MENNAAVLEVPKHQESYGQTQQRMQSERNARRTKARHESAADTHGEVMVKIGNRLILNRVQLAALIGAVEALNDDDLVGFDIAMEPIPDSESERTIIEFGRLHGVEFERVLN